MNHRAKAFFPRMLSKINNTRDLATDANIIHARFLKGALSLFLCCYVSVAHGRLGQAEERAELEIDRELTFRISSELPIRAVKHDEF